MGAATLEEAVRDGQGIERPFRCPKHDDSNASASVNILKGVWYCYACNESGFVDKSKKRTPTHAEIRALLEPEASIRVYPELWLDTFTGGTYWGTRFPDWLVWYASLGEDPFTGQATFPVRTPTGKLAGVGRRATDDQMKEGEAEGRFVLRYRYPSGWSASRVLHGMDKIAATDVIVLVEGAADQTAVMEVGGPGLGCYGAGLHLPQREMVMRFSPKLVLLGFDMDDAGNKAAERTAEILLDVETRRVEWPKKDPAECTVDERYQALADALGSVGVDAYAEAWHRNVARMKDRYEVYLAETG